MVWARMGMLDDAIREHLELKRLRGADPGDVAREERDALGPIRREALAAPAKDADAEVGPAQFGKEEAAASDASAFQAPTPESDPHLAEAGAGQETVEINMEAELGGDAKKVAEPPAPHGGGRSAPVGHPAHTQASSEESLEWEMPGDRSQDAATEGTADDGGQDPADEPVEDVLEETPDFLRDTPEQERLWFEQRPPRDFDFNE